MGSGWRVSSVVLLHRFGWRLSPPIVIALARMPPLAASRSFPFGTGGGGVCLETYPRGVSDVVVRSIGVADWPVVKALRLEMLEDSPRAFITTYEQAAVEPDEVWIARCTPDPDDRSHSVGAFTEGRAVGMAVGLDASRLGRRVVAVVSVYVAPPCRGSGIADEMMERIEEWATLRRAGTTSLWVVDGNDRARRFYERRGYRMTLDRQKIRTPPVRWEGRMEKRLRG